MSIHISDKIQHALHHIDPNELAQDVWHILQEQKFAGFLPHFVVQHLCNKYQFNSTTTGSRATAYCSLLCYHTDFKL